MKTFKDFLGRSKPEDSHDYIGTTNHADIHKNKEVVTETHNPLNYHERASIEKYTGSNPIHNGHMETFVPAYKTINMYHRFPGDQKYLDKESTEAVNHHTGHLDSAIGKHTTEKETHVWRGIHENAFDHLDMKPGDHFHDKGFVSTSINPDTANMFAHMRNGENKKQLMHIKVPKGSNAIHSNNREEDEVILPRNSRFKYEGSEIHDKAIVHHVTHIPEGS